MRRGTGAARRDRSALLTIRRGCVSETTAIVTAGTVTATAMNLMKATGAGDAVTWFEPAHGAFSQSLPLSGQRSSARTDKLVADDSQQRKGTSIPAAIISTSPAIAERRILIPNRSSSYADSMVHQRTPRRSLAAMTPAQCAASAPSMRVRRACASFSTAATMLRHRTRTPDGRSLLSANSRRASSSLTIASRTDRAISFVSMSRTLSDRNHRRTARRGFLRALP